MRRFLSPYLLSFFFIAFLCSSLATAQSVVVGILRDADTGKALSSASVFVERGKLREGVVTQSDGSFRLEIPEVFFKQDSLLLQISSLGYTPCKRSIPNKPYYDCGILEIPSLEQHLEAVVVTLSKYESYRHNNPAIEVVHKVVERRRDNGVEGLSAFSFRSYEKILLTQYGEQKGRSFWGIPAEVVDDWKVPSIFFDSHSVPISLREQSSVTLVQNGKEETTIIGRRHFGPDEVLDEDLLTNNLFEMVRSVDPYANDIELFTQHFVSPLNEMLGSLFYKYSLMDTTFFRGDSCFVVQFAPTHHRDAAFFGRMVVDMKNYSLRLLEMELSQKANVSKIDRIRFCTEFAPHKTERGELWLPQQQTIQAAFIPTNLYPKGLEGHIIRYYHGHCWGEKAFLPECLDPRSQLPPELYQRSLEKCSGTFGWVERPIPLTSQEQRAIDFNSYLSGNKKHKTLAQIIHALYTGFVPLPIHSLWTKKNYFDLGPVDALFGGNTIEGFRVRLGGTTTAILHPHFFLQGYGAYGFSDRRWKYYIKGTYSVHKKQYHEEEFPRKNFSVYLHNDLFIPGKEKSTLDRDHLILDFPGEVANSTRFYGTKIGANFEQDFSPQCSLTFGIEYMQKKSAGLLHYYKQTEDNSRVEVQSISQTSIDLAFVYRPLGQPFNPRRLNAYFDMRSSKPVLSLEAHIFPPFLKGNSHFYVQTTAIYYRKIFLSALGHMEMAVKAGKVWGAAPQVSLFSPQTNTGWLLYEDDFQTLKPLQYIADRFFEFRSTYHMNGLLLNRIPLLNKLKMREVFTLHGYWGHTSSEHRIPKPGAQLLPETLVTPMNNHLHLEMGVGVENLFGLMRIDLYTQLSNYINLNRNKPVIRLNLSLFL